jgi:hypothetical protein
MSLVIANEPLAILSATPITVGQVVEVPCDLARSMIKRGLACKAFPYSLAVYPVRIAPVNLNPPVNVHAPRRTNRRRTRTETGYSHSGIDRERVSQ